LIAGLKGGILMKQSESDLPTEAIEKFDALKSQIVISSWGGLPRARRLPDRPPEEWQQRGTEKKIEIYEMSHETQH